MSGAGAQFLKARLFLEGVEIPVISAQVQAAKNSPAVSSIQIPANDYALELLPRTLVHLFNYDIYNGAPAEVRIEGEGVRVQQTEDGVDPDLNGLFPPDRFESTPDQDQTDLINQNFKLLFGGEIVGFSFSKSASGSRNITLQCMDWSSYWDIAYQYQVSGFSLGGSGYRGAFSGAATTVFNDFLEGSADVVTKLINTPPRTYPEMSGTLLSGIMHIIESIGGCYFGERAVRGVNDFFSLAEMRLHITQMVGANPYSNQDERRLLAANGFGSLFRRSLAGLGRQVSIRQILLALQRYIFHEIVPITSPRYIPPLYNPSAPSYETLTIQGDEETRPLGTLAERIKARANELKDRQMNSTDADAAQTQSDSRGGLRQELTDLIRQCNNGARLARLVGRGNADAPLADVGFGISSIVQAFTVAGERFGAVSSSLRVPGNRRVFAMADSSSAGVVVGLLDNVVEQMNLILNSQHYRRVQRTSHQPSPPARLLTQLYRPDVWMVAPPRCNVIFPELYSNFSYGRNYMQEPTRMLLRVSSAFFGSDILFDGFYMTPSNVVGARSGRLVTVGRDPELINADYPLHIRRDLLDHELYTGIIPVFERMSDLNLHALRGGYYEMNGTRIAYAQFACNHMFFQQRFQSRQLQLSGKFNPYVVLGFPVLVIDRWKPVDELRIGETDAAIAARLGEILAEGDGINRNPQTDAQMAVVEANYSRINDIVGDILTTRPNTQYLGTPEMIVHSVDASAGGTTQIQMAYSRTTTERTEFIDANVGTTSRRTRNVRVTKTVAATEEYAPRVGDTGIRGGNIITVTDVTSEFLRSGRATRQRSSSTTTGGVSPSSQHASTRTAPLFVSNPSFRGRARRGTRVVVGVEQPAAAYGPEVVAMVGAGGEFDASTVSRAPWSPSGSAGEGASTRTEILVTFRAYRIVEEIGAYRRTQVELPPEFLCFPPWYGDHWRTEQVGGLYAYFFGTGAITDPLVVEAGSGSSDSQRADAGAAMPSDQAERTLRIQFAEALSAQFRPMANDWNGVPPTDPEFSSPQPGLSSTDDIGGDVPGPPGTPATLSEASINGELGRVSVRSPIAVATEELVRIYSQVKLNQFDVHAFIKAYTWRPIASMVDLFGTANLEINDQGEVVRGVEGFHSRAFGDFDDLRQLVNNVNGSRPQTILGLQVENPDETGDPDDPTSTNPAQIAARLDTRKEKRTAVLRYLFSLMAGCGVLG